MLIRPLHRSKWINETSRSSSRNMSGPRYQEWAAGPDNRATGYPGPQAPGGMPPLNQIAVPSAPFGSPYMTSGYPPAMYPPVGHPVPSPAYAPRGPVAASPTHSSGNPGAGRVGSKPPTGSPSVSPTTIATRGAEDEQEPPKHANAQSKPPSEEALDAVNQTARSGAPTPTSHRSEPSPTAKARVALPMVSLRGVHDKEGGKSSAKAPDAKAGTKGKSSKPAADAKNPPEASDKQNSTGAEKDPAREQSSKPTVPKKQGHEETVPKGKEGVATASVAESNEPEETKHADKDPGRVSKPTVSEKMGHGEAARNGKGKVPAAFTTADSEPQPGVTSEGKARAPSIFTEEQIKGRKQAWNRISMPLSPHKVGRPVETVSGEPSSSETAQSPANVEVPKTSMGTEMTLGGDSSTTRSDSDGSKTITQESGPTANPRHRFKRVANVLRRVFENRHASEKSKVSVSDAAATNQPAGQAPGGESSKQGKNKRKKQKTSRVATSASAMSSGPPGANPQPLAQRDDEAAQGRELRLGPGIHAEPRAAGAATVQCPGRPSQDQDGNGQADGLAVDGLKSPSAQYGPKQEYGADAGGSLRMPKKRHNGPRALDTQSASLHGHHAGAPTSSSSSSFEFVSRNHSDVNLGRHAQQSAANDASPNPGLNPLAKPFVSPTRPAVGNKGVSAGKGGESRGGYRGGSTRGGPARLQNHPSPSRKDVREVFAPERPESKETVEHQAKADNNAHGQKDAAGRAQVSKKKSKSRPEAKRQDGSPGSAKEAPKHSKDAQAEEWPSLPSPEVASSTSTATTRPRL